jgi:hypothetical protein
VSRIKGLILVLAVLFSACAGTGAGRGSSGAGLLPETPDAAAPEIPQIPEEPAPAIPEEPEIPSEVSGELEVPGEEETGEDDTPDLAETDKPPDEAPLSVRLPEPPLAGTPYQAETEEEGPAGTAPEIPEAPESRPVEMPEAETPKAETGPPVRGPLPETSPQAEAVPPAPPPFLHPAEEPPPAAREAPPRPAAEPPAFTEIPPVPPEDEDIVFSRVVRATAGQLVEIPFRGTGWVYLGEMASRRGIAYSSRRLDPEGQSFIFRAEEAGSYVLKFYKEDFIRDYILNDYVQVIVGEAPGGGAGWFSPPVDRGRVTAEPRWPGASGEAEGGRGEPGSGRPPPSGTVLPAESPREGGSRDTSGTPDEQTAPGDSSAPPGSGSAGERDGGDRAGDTDSAPDGETETGTTEPAETSPDGTVPSGASPETYFQKALEEFNAGRTGSAIAVMNSFRERFPSGSDEAWWLLGQFYEANSPSRDIRMSLDYYRRLVREYPQSRRYNDASRRIAYLERFYINIR